MSEMVENGSVNGKPATGRRRAAGFRHVLKKLSPGDACYIKIAGDHPSNRVAYLQLNGAAYALWGPGSYSMSTARGEIGVIRKRAAIAKAAAP